jgi:hypothetical protein
VPDPVPAGTGFVKEVAAIAWRALLTLLMVTAAVAQESSGVDTRPPIAPDIREDESELKFQRGNAVVVPIPVSNPTVGTGLVAGGAWFYGQSAEQRAEQPASVTAIAALYTNNDSRALVVGHQNYWSRNRWRFTGAIGAADMRLSLPVPDGAGGTADSDWQVDGAFLFAKLSRKIGGNWYGGFQLRAIDADQAFTAFDEASADFDVEASIYSIGAGALIEFDSRDMPINSYAGRYFSAATLLNDEAFGSDSTYQSYSAALSSYHLLRENLVFAWEVQGCARGGDAPLWDACTIHLRGFSATDYLGTESASAQAELRWGITPRWGAVGFAGAGYAANALNEKDDREPVPSYGIGFRFMVLPAKRVNVRVDFARSDDSDAIHVSVGEAF